MKLTSFILAAGFLAATPAFAFVDLQLLYGARTAAYDYYDNNGDKQTKDVTGTEYGAALQLTPYWKVPVSIGIAGATQTFDTGKAFQSVADEQAAAFSGVDAKATGKLTGLVYGPEITAWIPIRYVKPYVRAGYMMGTYKDESDLKMSTKDGVSPAQTAGMKSTTNYTSAGTEVGLGLRISPVPYLSLVVEYNIATMTNKVKDVTLTNEEAKDGTVTSNTTETLKPDDLSSDQKSEKFSTRAVRVGIQIGF